MCTGLKCTLTAVTGGNLMSSAYKDHNHKAIPFLMQTNAFKAKLTGTYPKIL